MANRLLVFVPMDAEANRAVLLRNSELAASCLRIERFFAKSLVSMSDRVGRLHQGVEKPNPALHDDKRVACLVVLLVD